MFRRWLVWLWWTRSALLLSFKFLLAEGTLQVGLGEPSNDTLLVEEMFARKSVDHDISIRDKVVQTNGAFLLAKDISIQDCGQKPGTLEFDQHDSQSVEDLRVSLGGDLFGDGAFFKWLFADLYLVLDVNEAGHAEDNTSCLAEKDCGVRSNQHKVNVEPSQTPSIEQTQSRVQTP